MTLAIKHDFECLKGDPPDETLVRPSNWNADHSITMAANRVIGTVAAGEAGELLCTAQGRIILAASTLSELLSALNLGAFTTGDYKLTIKTVADPGWVMCDDGTIGSADSLATTRAHADTLALYTLIYNAIPDTYAPVSGGRGVDAATSFSANKTIALTKKLGRALAVAGAGAGLTPRALGSVVGEEAHKLIPAEMPIHTHDAEVDEHGGHTHPTDYGNSTASSGGGGNFTVKGTAPMGTGTTGNKVTGITVANAEAGGDTPHENMQPTGFDNLMMKL